MPDIEIPEFPESRPLFLDDKPRFDRLLAAARFELSQYTFTNIFAWRRTHRVRVSTLGKSTIVWHDLPDAMVFLEPMGEGPARDAVERCLDYPWGRNAEFRYLTWNTVALFQADPHFLIEIDRNNSDYIYLASDLIDLPGGRYDGKRNFIRRFAANHEYRYLEMDPELARRCREFQESWCAERSCQSDEGLGHEREAVIDMLDNYPALGYRGGALEVEGKVVAFALGEPLGPETLVVHVEKADARLTGIYAAMTNEFCRHEAAGYRYVNREQDLGLPGLRQAKRSYHPTRMVDAFRLRRAGT